MNYKLCLFVQVFDQKLTISPKNEGCKKKCIKFLMKDFYKVST